jgi:hypothetical protein
MAVTTESESKRVKFFTEVDSKHSLPTNSVSNITFIVYNYKHGEGEKYLS